MKKEDEYMKIMKDKDKESIKRAQAKSKKMYKEVKEGRSGEMSNSSRSN